MKRMDRGIQRSACIFTIISFFSMVLNICITIQSNIVYKMINDKNIRYDVFVLLFFVLLATYPNTIELIMIAITTNIMVILLYTIYFLLNFINNISYCFSNIVNLPCFYSKGWGNSYCRFVSFLGVHSPF